MYQRTERYRFNMQLWIMKCNWLTNVTNSSLYSYFIFGNHEPSKWPVCSPFSCRYFRDGVPKNTTFSPPKLPKMTEYNTTQNMAQFVDWHFQKNVTKRSLNCRMVWNQDDNVLIWQGLARLASPLYYYVIFN